MSEYVLQAPRTAQTGAQIPAGARVEIDPSAAARIKKESPAPKDFQAQAAPPPNVYTYAPDGTLVPDDNDPPRWPIPPSSWPALPPPLARAAVFARLATLANGASLCLAWTSITTLISLHADRFKHEAAKPEWESDTDCDRACACCKLNEHVGRNLARYDIWQNKPLNYWKPKMI